MALHTFNESKNRAYEEEIDLILSDNGYTIENVTREEQRRGIDKFAVNKYNENLKLEYKSDLMVYKTKNFFIETISVSKEDKEDKLGWAHTSEADFLVYFMPKDYEVWLIEMHEIKRMLPNWKAKYPTKKCHNKGYSSHGILVPRKEIEDLIYDCFEFCQEQIPNSKVWDN